jgi:hypothetical protein
MTDTTFLTEPNLQERIDALTTLVNALKHDGMIGCIDEGVHAGL